MPKRVCATGSYDETMVYGTQTSYAMARDAALRRDNRFHDNNDNAVLHKLDIIVNTCRCQQVHCF